MRGSPLLRFFVMAALVLLAGIPVFLLTRPRPLTPDPQQAPSPAIPASKRDLGIMLTASSPARIQVVQLGSVILEGEGKETLEGSVSVNSQNPDDLVIRAEWNDPQKPHALRVQMTDSTARPVLDRTFWAEGVVEDVVTPPSE